MMRIGVGVGVDVGVWSEVRGGVEVVYSASRQTGQVVSGSGGVMLVVVARAGGAVCTGGGTVVICERGGLDGDCRHGSERGR